jgi:hypothetical protein
MNRPAQVSRHSNNTCCSVSTAAARAEPLRVGHRTSTALQVGLNGGAAQAHLSQGPLLGQRGQGGHISRGWQLIMLSTTASLHHVSGVLAEVPIVAIVIAGCARVGVQFSIIWAGMQLVGLADKPIRGELLIISWSHANGVEQTRSFGPPLVSVYAMHCHASAPHPPPAIPLGAQHCFQLPRRRLHLGRGVVQQRLRRLQKPNVAPQCRQLAIPLQAKQGRTSSVSLGMLAPA